MTDIKQLAAACDAVVERLQTDRAQPVRCPLCDAPLSNQDTLLVHLFDTHNVCLADLAGAADVAGLLSTAEACVFGPTRAAGELIEVHCPVCTLSLLPAGTSGVSCKADALPFLAAHLTEAASHNVWNSKTIPALAPFLVPVLDDDAQGMDQSSAAQAQADDDQEGWEAVDDLDEGWEEPMQCLYCSEETPTCLEHMRTAHAFDLPAATRAHGSVKDEYDVIRLLNAVRAAWQEGQCPGCDFRGTEAEREAHLCTHADHRLPALVPAGDEFLRPVIPGDSLLSLVVTSGEGFLPCEPEDPDFPMVPTVQERAAAQRQ